MSDLQIYDYLTHLAQSRNRRVKRWCSRRSTASVRTYVCNVCDAEIDSESTKYAATRHAMNAVTAHHDKHRDEMSDAERAAVIAGAYDVAWEARMYRLAAREKSA
jgi:hypothetical protein